MGSDVGRLCNIKPEKNNDNCDDYDADNDDDDDDEDEDDFCDDDDIGPCALGQALLRNSLILICRNAKT